MILGDWNQEPAAPEWQPLRELEQSHKIRFEAWNSGEEASHFFKSGKDSRLDLVTVTEEAVAAAANKPRVVAWKDFLKSKAVLRDLIDKLSDHLPVYTRFYFSKPK
jgi:endonuclease/exonuclease/phosphatase family metal-dependent hydrolase